MAARRISQSFDRPTSLPRIPYRQVHVNGLLAAEGEDYEWQTTNLLVFTRRLDISDTILVGVGGARPSRVHLQGSALPGTPIHLDGTIGLIIDQEDRQVGVEGVQITEVTIYDFLFQDD